MQGEIGCPERRLRTEILQRSEIPEVTADDSLELGVIGERIGL